MKPLLLAVFAVVSLVPAFVFGLGRHAPTPSPLAAWAAFSVLRILVAPLLALAFLLCGVLSPFRFARAACLAAAVTEAVVSAYGGFTWFVPLFFERPWMYPH